MNHLLHSGVYPLNEKLSGLLLVTFSVSVCQDLEAVVQTYSVKKLFLEISQNPEENTWAGVSFSMKLQVSGLQLCLKRDPDTGVFL